MISLSFYGAAGMVTGSKYLLQVNDEKVMIDCGMFQGRREIRELNWKPQPYKPHRIGAVIITHGHIDHIGFLPRLFRMEYRGPVYATPPTIDIAKISLADAAHIQMEDADYRNRKNLTRHKKALPLFNDKDVAKIESKYRAVEPGVWKKISNRISFRFHPVGHILGAASVEVIANDGKIERSILFSGDIGRYGNPLTRIPEDPPPTDYIVCESTYGGRLHKPADPHQLFMNLIKEIHETGGVLLIPAFAIGRTQQIVVLIDQLITNGLAPETDVHIDSPMAIAATEIYNKHHDRHGVDTAPDGGFNIFENPRIHFHNSVQESKALNKMKGPRVILSASGMMTAGRILHHMIVRLPVKKNILAIVGYQVEGALGRILVDGAKQIHIHKQPVDVNARIENFSGLSGHADYYEILHWVEKIARKPAKVFITHGEKSQSESLAGKFKEEKGWDCHIPNLNETVELT